MKFASIFLFTAAIASQANASLLIGANAVDAFTLRGKSRQAKTAPVLADLADDTVATYALNVSEDGVTAAVTYRTTPPTKRLPPLSGARGRGGLSTPAV